MKKISFMLAVLLLSLTMIIPSVAVDDSAELFAVSDIYTTFVIRSEGLAVVAYGCYGDATTESIQITIKIEKKTLLVFWTDVTEWTVTHYTPNASGEKTYQLEKGGTYRCTVTWEITSTDGTVDTIEDVKEVKYDPA